MPDRSPHVAFLGILLVFFDYRSVCLSNCSVLDVCFDVEGEPIGHVVFFKGMGPTSTKERPKSATQERPKSAAQERPKSGTQERPKNAAQ